VGEYIRHFDIHNRLASHITLVLIFLTTERHLMSAYVFVNVEVHDPVVFEEYKTKAPAVIKRHGGEYLVRGGNHIILEGDWKPTRLVLLRFPDITSAQAFYNDPEYQTLKALRQRGSRLDMVAVEGM
jgi:uncharacterized protein (DUF1330 family)